MSDSGTQPVALYDPGEVGRTEHNRGDRFVVHLSNLFAWLLPILVGVICTQVVLRTMGRYQDNLVDVPVLGALSLIGNQAWLDDLQWWIYGIAVLVGVAYAVTTNSHVRVDIFYDNFDERKKTRTDIFGLTWLFLPFILLAWDMTVHYAISSVKAWEGSDSPNGLHNLWALKLLMNASFLAIAVAIWAAYRRLLARLVYPTLFQQLLGALPAFIFAVNLACYYAIWWVLKLTARNEDGEPLSEREVGRLEIFKEWEVGQQEIPYTILITADTAKVIKIDRKSVV